MKKQGLADAKGMPVKDNVFKMINGTMDPEVTDMATEMLGKCIDDKCKGCSILHLLKFFFSFLCTTFSRCST